LVAIEVVDDERCKRDGADAQGAISPAARRLSGERVEHVPYLLAP
jgi:hypothetical protein